ncbi:hypothetical protein [Larkinella rosea]|uniref:Uncharacterized protein n=1 Tax=Larkinella rosea TaxID=2025312 RepID=A0A3P1BG91_9BACT|nr:hypothetical protein [Larkinella rosea]RRB00101.1 hypothetical protein EHT25_26115 [Larkinella rosea]
MKKTLILILLGIWISLATGWATPQKPSGIVLMDSAVTNFLKRWENRVNRLSNRVDSAEINNRRQAALTGFFIADTVQIPDLRQPAVIYRHTIPQVSARNWVGGFSNLFWEDVFQFKINPSRMQVVAKKRNRVQLEVTVFVELTGIRNEGRQPHHLRDAWVLTLEAKAMKSAYRDLAIRSIRRLGGPVELPGLTLAKVADYHDRLQHWFVRFLADSSQRTEARWHLKELMRSDTVLVRIDEKTDTLTLDQLLQLKLRTESVARFQVQSFDMEYCDEFLRNPDNVLVGQLILLEGITVSADNQQLYQRRRTDAVPFPSHHSGRWAQVSNVTVNWNKPSQTR